MRCEILSENSGRMRVHADVEAMSLAEADVLEYYMKSIPGVTRVKVHDRACNAIIHYECARESIVEALASFAFADEKAIALVPDHTGREADREYENKLAGRVILRYAVKMFLPHDIRLAITIVKSAGHIARGLAALWKRSLNVDVLDATSIGISMARDDHDTASSVMFLLGAGGLLEEWAHKKSIEDLAGMMALNIDKAWVCDGDDERLLPVSQIQAGDQVVVRMGNMIPLDGKVVRGEAMVNQATMTGESMPVRKETGSYVYGGTVVEEGECTFLVDKELGRGRYDRIVRMIEESEALKTVTESKAAALADRLVPYSFAGTALVYALTGNFRTASTFLMVDYSCALKLTMPLAVLAAMKEAGMHKITVKGGKFLEEISEADTIVFDKTGTLTNATPRVAKVVAFGGRDESEMLRMAACLEEHFPHSMANAVVEAAKAKGLDHEEMHSSVEYVVAHGITSTVEGRRVSIGSYHYIFDDENTRISPEDEEALRELPEEWSLLYMACDGSLAAVICIDDPVREDVSQVIETLRSSGFKRIVMMTGDNEKTASHVAKRVGIDEYIAGVLPEDKAGFIATEKAKGHKVVMIGDGINDSPALSEADVGIAVNSGAAIAREISDVTIESDDLSSLVVLKRIADGMMKRTTRDYRAIVAFNTMLIALGVAGVLTPSTSSLLHNLSTVAISTYNITTKVVSD